MFMTALLIAGITTGAYVVVDLIRSHRKEPTYTTLVAGGVLFILTLFSTWFWLWSFTPSMHFGTYYWTVLICTCLVIVVGGVKNGIVGYDDAYGHRTRTASYFAPGPYVAGAFLVFWIIFGIAHGITKTGGQEMATQLASMVNIERADIGEYPETDPEHMVLMSEEAARFKADQSLNTIRDELNISSIYDLNDAALQSIDGHLYWAFDLKFDGWRNANKYNRIVPCYTLVDAENPDASPTLECGYEMRYTPGSPTDTSIKRLIWREYRNYVIDDITFEVDDQGNPYYTATINKPATTFETALPVKAIIVNPQTGEITEYEIEDVPTWVDRIYSDDVVKQMMNWWGHWGAGPEKAPFRLWRESGANRYRVAGDPTLVYVNDGGVGHPEWQIIMKSWKTTDESATYVVLFNARANSARIFEVPNLQTEKAAIGVFESDNANLRSNDARHAAMHMIYGRLTWVVSFIPDSESESPKSFAGLGLMAADSVQATSAILAESKETVLADYRTWLTGANGSSADPNAESVTTTVSGTIAQVSTMVVDGTTNFLVILEEDPARVFRGVGDATRVELPFAQPGAQVTIEYIDVDTAIQEILEYDDEALSLRR
jgi:hypothetical protein